MPAFYTLIRGLAARLCKDRRGNVAILFGLTLIPIIGFVGGAIDYTNAYEARTKLQGAIDAAALAAAREIRNGGSKSEAKRVAKKYMQANLGAEFSRTKHLITISKQTKEVHGEASSSVDTYVLGVIGLKRIPVSAEARVNGGGGNIEVALVLDNTGSMLGDKIATLKDAANQLVDTLMPNPTSQTVKIGVVPFADYVNIGPNNRNEPGLDIPDNYTVDLGTYCTYTYPNTDVECNYETIETTCTVDGQQFPCTQTIATNCTGDPGEPVINCSPTNTIMFRWYGCMASREPTLNIEDDTYSVRVPGLMQNRGYGPTCQPSHLTRLTDRRNAVRQGIQRMRALGDTYIPAGLIWGWRVLSSDIPFDDGAPDGSGVRKVVILMTDGMNVKSLRRKTGPEAQENEGGEVWTHSGFSTSQADQTTEDLCENMKQAGITMYTIAFDVTDPDVEELMSNCAGNGGGYYDADSNAELLAAFADIATRLDQMRLIN